MRVLLATTLCVFLGGCFATKQEVATRLSDQYIGKNVDALVVQFGPPTSSFRMNSGETSYVWQLAAETEIEMSGNRRFSSGTVSTTYCKVSVIASASGIVTRLATEDTSGTGQVMGPDLVGSICARRLGMKRES
ncbi:hypothetical protein ABIE49_005907 [Bradyrhizobium sp. OAE829]